MKALSNYSLKKHNSFNLNVFAHKFIEITSEQDLVNLITNKNLETTKYLVLGGGYNHLFTKGFDGLVIKSLILGKEVVSEDEENIFLRVHCGEDWPTLVEYCVTQGWGGIENLALIPGTVGAAPVQNIGAYGGELSDSLYSLTAVNLKNGEKVQLSASECGFSYRSSIFKTSSKNEFFITSITLKLSKNPVINLDYKNRYSALSDYIDASEPTITDVYNAVVTLRNQRLPDPNIYPNAGSFFENLILNDSELEKLIQTEPSAIYTKIAPNKNKVAVGYLLECIGWKNKKMFGGRCGTWKSHALIPVNYKGASATEMYELVKTIMSDFYDAYELELEPEVWII